jgi:hypothetical protein
MSRATATSTTTTTTTTTAKAAFHLNQIGVRQPCTADWDAMRGDERVRFCEGCQRHVHNLSAMPREEAERLICEAAGRLCVRFAQSASGEVLTLNYQEAKPHARRRFWGLLGIGGVLAAGASYAVADRLRPAPPPAPPPTATRMMMGDIVCPVPAGTATSPVDNPATASVPPPSMGSDGPPAAP